MNCLKSLMKDSLRANSSGCSGGGAPGILISASKKSCKKLIGGDDISNDVITIGTCFSMFIYIRARFRFALIGGNLTAQSKGSHRGIGSGIQIPET